MEQNAALLLNVDAEKIIGKLFWEVLKLGHGVSYEGIKWADRITSEVSGRKLMNNDELL